MRALRRQASHEGRYALVDGIPFAMPVRSSGAPALMAVFQVDYDRARQLLPGNEIHPLRFWNKALLIVTVIDYRDTVIGKYIEFSIGLGCTRGSRPAPPLLPVLFQKRYGTGQFVLDLPVSTEVSVKGGKGIWGMPKHQANLDFVITGDTVSSQYDLDGELCARIEIDRPPRTRWPIRMGGVNYCAFRGMLMKSSIHVRGTMGFNFRKRGSARLVVGNHLRVAPLRALGIARDPLLTIFFSETSGTLDDHFESWFLTYDRPPTSPMEGLESVVHLGQGREWLAPPHPRVSEQERVR